MKRFLLFLTLGTLALNAGAQSQRLGAPAELTLDAPWTQPVGLEFPSEGPYRLEATGLGGDSVEVVLEQRDLDGSWKPKASNRKVQGGIAVSVDFAVAEGESWRVRPVQKEPRTVILRLRASVFAALRDSVKQDLTLSPEVSLPLRKRTELPLGTGGPSVAAAAGSQGEFWVGWISGPTTQVWEVRSNQRLQGPPSALAEPRRVALEAGPALTVRGQEGSESWAWTGAGWQTQASEPELLTTPWGVFRSVSSPPQVWRSTPAGWADLELPQDRNMNSLLLGATDDGLYALLAGNGRARSFYQWRPSQGWQALPPPPATAAPQPGLWAATSAGSLVEVEAQGSRLTLLSFDGSDWRPPLDLSALAPLGAKALCLVGPSVWSRTGSLVIVTDRVCVYDLP